MDDHYPTAARACMACRPDSAVIDCNGNIFKCRTQTGELDKKIGNVLNPENQTRKEAIQEINWAEWSPFEFKMYRMSIFTIVYVWLPIYVIR